MKDCLFRAFRRAKVTCPHMSDKDRTAKHNQQNIGKRETVAQANQILNGRPDVSTLHLLYNQSMTQHHVETSDKVLNMILWLMILFQFIFLLPLI